MRNLLIALFSAVLLAMLYVTITASLAENILTAGGRLWADAWFRATLADACFGFLTFYVWVAYKETRLAARLGWLVGIVLLGNIAMALYLLRELITLPAGRPLVELLTRRR